MEKNMEQKRLTLSEYDAIVAFDRLCFPEDHWTEEDWRELLADERAVYLALLDDGRIIDRGLISSEEAVGVTPESVEITGPAKEYLTATQSRSPRSSQFLDQK